MPSFDAERAAGKAILAILKEKPLGSLSKSDAEAALLATLVASGRVDLNDSAFKLGQQLRLTPGRVRSLLLNYRLHYTWKHDLTDAQKRALPREPVDGSEDVERERYADVLRTARFARVGEKVEFLVTDPYIKQIAIAQIERRNNTADLALSANIIRVSIETFVSEIEQVLTSADVKRWKSTLGEDPTILLHTDVDALKSALRAAASLAGSPGVAVWDTASRHLASKASQKRAKRAA